VLIWCFTSGDLKIVREVLNVQAKDVRGVSKQKARQSCRIDFRTEDSIEPQCMDHRF
jgi:hypothetical protein